MIRKSTVKQKGKRASKSSGRRSPKAAAKQKRIECSPTTAGHLVALAVEHDKQAAIQEEWKDKAASLSKEVVLLNTDIRERSKKLNPKKPSKQSEMVLHAKAKVHDKKAQQLKEALDRKNAAKEGKKSAVATLLETVRSMGHGELLFDQKPVEKPGEAVEPKPN